MSEYKEELDFTEGCVQADYDRLRFGKVRPEDICYNEPEALVILLITELRELREMLQIKFFPEAEE